MCAVRFRCWSNPYIYSKWMTKTCLKIWCQGDSKIKNKSFNDLKKNYPPMFLILLEKSERCSVRTQLQKRLHSTFLLNKTTNLRCKLWLLYITDQTTHTHNFPRRNCFHPQKDPRTYDGKDEDSGNNRSAHTVHIQIKKKRRSEESNQSNRIGFIIVRTPCISTDQQTPTHTYTHVHTHKQSGVSS